jgi:hypothetical protein
MSGPTTALITANPVAVVLTAAAIVAARAIAQGYREAEQLHAQHSGQQADNAKAQQQAQHAGQLAFAADLAAAESMCDQLIAYAEQQGCGAQLRAARPAPPVGMAGSASYLQALQVLNNSVRSALLTEAARLMANLPPLPDAIDVPAERASLGQRLLARIEHLGDVPQDLAALGLELDQMLPGERQSLLATELRSRVQAHAAAISQQQVQEASAIVLEQSLLDLGYQVEDVTDTLFVDGGIIHFRRRDWGNYMVRMRVDAKAGAANFNVIRAVQAGENERSVLDHLAEDRWCAEFPALLKALEARGLALQVTRRLEAGELPVQLVEHGKLPRFAEEEHAAPGRKPLTRELP